MVKREREKGGWKALGAPSIDTENRWPLQDTTQRATLSDQHARACAHPPPPPTHLTPPPLPRARTVTPSSPRAFPKNSIRKLHWWFYWLVILFVATMFMIRIWWITYLRQIELYFFLYHTKVWMEIAIVFCTHIKLFYFKT